MESNNYENIEVSLFWAILTEPDFDLEDTKERLCVSFCLTDINNNKNKRSNYKYAKEFFKWIITGDTELSSKIKKMNPFAEKFIDKTNLPVNFSSTYGWKIKEQLPLIIKELKTNPDSRRAYTNILLKADKKILKVDTTHEYPCTIGIHYMIRDNKLVCIVNMRSNNVWSVLPYDVYNFTELQKYIANKLKVVPGNYYHMINSAHIFRKDIVKISQWSQ